MAVLFPAEAPRLVRGEWPVWGNSGRITAGHDRLDCAPEAAIRLARRYRQYATWPSIFAIGPIFAPDSNNSTRLSRIEWLWSTKRASVWVTGASRCRVN